MNVPRQREMLEKADSEESRCTEPGTFAARVCHVADTSHETISALHCRRCVGPTLGNERRIERLQYAIPPKAKMSRLTDPGT